MTALVQVRTISDLWRDRADGHVPGGVNSPVRAYRAVGGRPPILVRGKGAYVWDANGRRYLDLIGGFGPQILGHAHPAVVRSVSSAARDGGPFGATHPSDVLLAERICEAMPSIEKLRFEAWFISASFGAREFEVISAVRAAFVAMASGKSSKPDR